VKGIGLALAVGAQFLFVATTALPRLISALGGLGVKRTALLLAFGALLLVHAVPASAYTVDVTYSGVVTSLDPNGGGRFALGDPFILSLVVDASAPDTDGASEIGNYFNVLGYIGLINNSYLFGSQSSPDQLYLWNFPDNDRAVFYTGQLSAPKVGAFHLDNVWLQFEDLTGAMLGSDAVPGDLAGLLSLSQDNYVAFEFWSDTDVFTVYGTVTSALQEGGPPPPVAATPVPAALPLLVSALGGLGFVGWRRRRVAA